MKPLLIIGAKGHGRMIRSLWAHPIIGFLDRDETLHGLLVEDVKVLGGHALLDEYPTHPVALGIGTNSERKGLYEELMARGFLIVDFRHPDARVNVGAQIGKNVILNTGCIVEHDCVIGDHAHLCPGAVLCGEVTVGQGAVVGANATVKDGLTIGAWATVGCGAVVVKDVPAGLTVVGNPAQEIHKRQFDEDGYTLIRDLWDPQPLEWALKAYLEREAKALSGRSIQYSGREVNSIHGLKDACFERVLTSEKIMTLAAALLGEPVVPRAVEVFAKPPQGGLPSPWHQDNAYWCLEPARGLTVWIALDPSDRTNGGLTYLTGSHRLGLLPHEPSYAPGSSQTVRTLPGLDQLTPSLAPGDALVHTCLTVHGSAKNVSGRPRRAVTLQYAGLFTQVNRDKQRAYEASLAEQLRGRA
jgi:sugar O-acyltransferase (sialic acid O-acetyltransferase NeuD family)